MQIVQFGKRPREIQIGQAYFLIDRASEHVAQRVIFFTDFPTAVEQSFQLLVK